MTSAAKIMAAPIKVTFVQPGKGRDFGSDELADVTVKCNDKVWKLHKVILCPGSPWFKKALLGSFEEARTNEVTLHDIETEHFEWIVQYLYRGKVDFPNKETMVLSALHCWQIANYFAIDGLLTLVESELTAHFKAKGREIQLRKMQSASVSDDASQVATAAAFQPRTRIALASHPRPLPNAALLEREYAATLATAMDGAFSSGCERIQKVFFTLISTSSWWVLEEKWIWAVVDKQPVLASMTLKALMQDFGLRGLIDDVPLKCSGCRKPKTEARASFATRAANKVNTAGMCERCVSVGKAKKRNYNK